MPIISALLLSRYASFALPCSVWLCSAVTLAKRSEVLADVGCCSSQLFVHILFLACLLLWYFSSLGWAAGLGWVVEGGHCRIDL